LESEVLTLKKMRDDMSAKLVEHDEMSANLEKENELLRTTYAKCIEEEVDNLRKYDMWYL
jgi:GTP-sensing pleiotropic transcriptional regulator CodY